MNTRSKFFAAAIGLLVATGAVADASAATIVTKTRTAAATRTVHPVLAKKTVIAHRMHRPHLALTRALPGHRLAPRIKVARAFNTKHIVKTTVVR